MQVPDEPPALAYIEKTLADAYRKEIDQEENVWRSLPFFVATLALQLAALFQVVDKIAEPVTAAGRISIVLLCAVAVLTLLSLSFLAASIYPQRFDYVAKQEALLTYAQALIIDERAASDQRDAEPLSALVTLKTELARQYAQAIDHNQQISKRRERQRSIAGLSALASILMTLLLVFTTYLHYLPHRVDEQDRHAATPSDIAPASSDGARTDPRRQAGTKPRDAAAANAGGH